ncbi:MAG: KH domain-containing protein [Candidatus Babeliales bacterium]
MIKGLVEFVVKSLAAEPEAVSVSVLHDGDKSMIEVRVAPDDFKRIIGKDGCVIKSLRMLVIAALQENREVRVEVVK